MSNTVVKLKNVNKEFYIYKNNFGRVMGIIFGRKPSETVHAVKNVSLTIEQGERVHIFGIVTSGVTTLQKLIAGMTYPTSGKVTVNGEINCLLEKNAGFDSEMSCMDNMYMRGNIIGLSRQEIKDHEEEIIEFAEMEHYKKNSLKQALKGTPIRLALAIHTLKKSDIFILDDGFTQGGKESKAKCQRRFNKFIDDHPDMTFIISGQGNIWAERHCTRGIVFYKGEIVFDGPIKEAIEEFTTNYSKK